ncbi:uncharacterized protein LOC120426491 [Culex pipiens pallens]|uniref:uncharacterized protein LOC120426491 n=1 Tax=Culex pipiens pallens TaxID=42434 RepID=UPI001952CE56|nr:uncharacterized protein LOC120426491 [Culex pipiens pallens]
MGKIVCAIEKCSRTRQSQSGSPSQRISLFSFPKDDEVLDKWLEFINQHNVNKLDKETLDRKRLRLCHLHFQRRDISHKGNKDRILLRNSVPDRPAKVIKHKPKSAKIQPEPTSGKSSPAPTSPTVANTAPTPSTATTSATDEASKPDSAPLYHSINGFVVDLRFASQLEMFRLPNGKLIQVRKQAKKAPAAATAVAEPEVAPPEGEKEQVVEISKDKAPEVVPDVSKKQAEVPVLTATPPTKKRSERVAKKGAAPPKMLVPPPPPPEPSKPAVPVHYKTYKNRRSQGAVLRIPQVPELVVPPAIPIATPEAPTPAPVRPPNPMPQTQVQKPRRPVVAPCLTALQSLIYKKHDEITPFDLFQKQFENQLISTAEIALHVVAKINNLINSNPFKTAETEQDLKYMYHHVGYILKYAIDRITGLTETCASDIKNMGFNEKVDLGPVFGAAVQDPEPTPPQVETTTATETPASTPAEPEPKEADDEDCAIVEEQPDMIEIDSDDDDDEQDQTAEQPTSATVHPKVEPSPRPHQISSDTEDHHNASRSTSSSSSESEASAGDGEHQFIISEIDEPRGVIRQDAETTLKIANVIEQYYGAESAEEEEQEEAAEAGKQAEPMEVDEQDSAVESQEVKESTGEATNTDEEETTELIEIIDGDDEPETDNDPEYSVLECGDGDYYLVTTDGDEV